MPFKRTIVQLFLVSFIFFILVLPNSLAQEAVVDATITADQPPPFGFDQWTALLGRFHPIVLHFPIGLLMGVFLLELAGVFRKFRNVEPAHWLLLSLSTLSAIVAATFGVFLSWEGGYEESAVFWHQWTGIGVAVLAVITFGLRVAFVRSWKNGLRTAYRLALLATILMVTIAGHYGGNLTHGSEFLFENMPAWMPMATVNRQGSGVDEVSGSTYAESIQSIFESRCYECHGETKIKGDFQLTTRENLLTPGESGEVAVVPGNASDSPLARMIALPEEHEHVMPPKGKGSLTGDEIVAIMQWIDRGADFGDGANLIELAAPKKEHAVIDTSDIDAGGQVNFTKHIWPIIEASCLECHNEVEVEGELRLDTKEFILEGGEFGAVLVPGNPDKSTFFELISLPQSDPDFMPAKNDPLPDAQIELIKRWIEEGCEFGDWTGE